MAVSVRMNPLLEKELEQAAKRQGVTKSQFIVDAVERALGRKDPFALLQQVHEEFAPYRLSLDDTPADPAVASRSVELSPRKQKLKDILNTKRAAEQADWLAYQAAKSRGEVWNPDEAESK